MKPNPFDTLPACVRDNIGHMFLLCALCVVALCLVAWMRAPGDDDTSPRLKPEDDSV